MPDLNDVTPDDLEALITINPLAAAQLDAIVMRRENQS